MEYLLLFIFFCFGIRWRKSNNVVKILLLLSLVSLIAGYFVDYHMRFKDLGSIIAIVIISLFQFLLIKPWTDIPSNLVIDKSIIITAGFNKYAFFLKCIGVLSMLVYIPIWIAVQNLGVDINQFKYDGGFEQFVYSGAFPIPTKLYILVIYLGELTILLIPLHFIYLQNGDMKNAMITLFGSLTYLFKGLVFFSRATPIIYIMLYAMFYIFTYRTMSLKIRKIVRVVTIIGCLILGYGFINTSKDRFESGKEIAGLASKQEGDMYKFFDDPTIISYFDYLGQGFYNSYHLIALYRGDTFKTQVTFHDIYLLLGQYLGLPFSENNYMNTRQSLWKDPYWYTFNTYTCYLIYDFGFILALCITLYFYKRLKQIGLDSRNGVISFKNFNYLVFFSLLASTSIFFSSLASCIIPFICCRLLMRFYLKQ